ncbi:hypothetical protein PPO43_14960 [Saprospira sp. CCB-QB6]|uniref:RDD family protein n=1 Tax=Saprospira sp. CCB-QB6 TaxID=3023936 RepID=UPI002349CC10|nr:RDD family protein [Saprospira sp. CCB-QB6]WCL81274.1 hypothetical protein PPO43_14960 [Saprospira sp. CCB-QB6]
MGQTETNFNTPNMAKKTLTPPPHFGRRILALGIDTAIHLAVIVGLLISMKEIPFIAKMMDKLLEIWGGTPDGSHFTFALGFFIAFSLAYQYMGLRSSWRATFGQHLLGLYWQPLNKEASPTLSWGSIHIHIWSKIFFLLLPLSFVLFLEDGFFLAVGLYYLMALSLFYNAARHTELGQLALERWSGWTLEKQEKQPKVSLEKLEQDFWAEETAEERLKERQNKS